jgi:hypothetical protein
MVLLSFAKGIGSNDDLVFFINRGNTIVALDGSFAGLHFG